MTASVTHGRALRYAGGSARSLLHHVVGHYPIALRSPPRGRIFHSDRGSQYCSHDYQKILREHGFRASMSGKGNCHDTGAVETFFKTITAELIWRRSWETRRQAETAIFQYINGFYNPRRRHSGLGGKSPLAYERQVA
jgi:putative transposase